MEQLHEVTMTNRENEIEMQETPKRNKNKADNYEQQVDNINHDTNDEV